jgi:hypothetical protein
MVITDKSLDSPHQSRNPSCPSALHDKPFDYRELRSKTHLELQIHLQSILIQQSLFQEATAINKMADTGSAIEEFLKPLHLDITTITSLLAVLLILSLSHRLSHLTLSENTPSSLRVLFIWHFFDFLIHTIFEGSFLYNCFFTSAPFGKQILLAISVELEPRVREVG